MSENSKASVISELQNIQTLIYEAEEKNAFLEYESDIAFSEKATLLREELGVLEKPAVFSHFPIFPLDESYFAAVKKDKDSKGKIFKIALIVTAALLILYFLTDWGFLNTLLKNGWNELFLPLRWADKTGGPINPQGVNFMRIYAFYGDCKVAFDDIYICK